VFTYVSDDGFKKPSISMHYRLGQAPPPRHWYQKRVGWFGRFMVMLLVVGLFGYAGNSVLSTRKNQQSFAAKTSQSTALNGTKSPIAANPDIENIIDVQSILDKWNKDHPGQKWAAVAKSVNGPSFEARLNPDQQFESASIYKLFLTEPLFSQIPVEQQAKINVSVNGSQKSIATCVDLMLRVSNNECGEALGNYISWAKAGDMLKKQGFSHTSFGKNGIKTSAGDTASFLGKLNSDMFTRTAKDTIMKSLYQQRYRDGIPAGCPGCIVANKTGQINDVVHDAALVQYKGGSYVLVIFSQNGSFKQIAQLTGQIQQEIIDSTNH
jgi:beta-lactamase class A